VSGIFERIHIKVLPSVDTGECGQKDVRQVTEPL